jgi:TonB family protein
MITQPNIHKPIPKRLSLTLFGVIIISTAIFMACTDMQTSEIFDNEELELMTDVDRDGTRGYHQILVFMGDEEQAERHMAALRQLNMAEENHIMSINVLKGQAAIDKYGEKGEKGVLEINTHISEESYNSVLKTLGMETQDLNLYDPDETEDFFVVVEEMPQLIGCLESLARQIQYPEMARRAGIEGRVFVQFIVDEEGEVVHPRVIRGIGGGADEEALRVVRQARFTPGIQRGQPVRVQFALPIIFRLPSSESGSETSTIENPTVIERNMSIEINRTDSGLSGTVLDSETNQPLAGASVIVDGSNAGSVTDANGNFSLSGIQSTQPLIVISYIGYETSQLQL